MKYRKPYRKKKKKSILRNRFFWLGFLSLIFIVFSSYFLIFSQFFQIRKIIVTGEEKVSKEEIKEVVEGIIEKEIVFFKTKSIFLVNLGEIREEILNNFPQIAEVEVGRGLPDALNILVTERLGLAVFCQEERRFLLDQEGIIFEEISKEDFSLPEIKKSNLENKFLENKLDLGEKAIEEELMSDILGILPELKKLEISTKEILVVSEERINIKTLDGWEIYFSFEEDLDWQLTKLRAVLEKYIPKEERKDLEYIELRFGDLAPYKYKGSAEISP